MADGEGCSNSFPQGDAINTLRPGSHAIVLLLNKHIASTLLQIKDASRSLDPGVLAILTLSSSAADNSIALIPFTLEGFNCPDTVSDCGAYE